MLGRLFSRSAPQPTASEAGRALGAAHRTSERNRVIDLANEMRAKLGKADMIPRRPQ